MMGIQHRLILFLAFFGSASVSGAADQSVPPAKPSQEISIALNAEFETLNPIVNSMMAAVYVLDATLRPVVALTPSGEPKAFLIKTIPSLKNKLAHVIKGENGVQALRAEIEFLPEVKWGDGVPLTCKDLKLSWEIGKSESVSTPNREDFTNIKDILISELNPKKCTVFFRQAKWDFYLSFPRPLPQHLEGPVFEKFKAQAQGYERNSLYVKDVTQPGLYNGPYRVSEHKFGSHIVLAENTHFSGLKPFFSKVIFKFILNTSTIEANLRSGGVQLASSSGLTFDQALAFEKKVNAEKLPYEVIFVPGVIYSHVDFNLDHPILKDIRVRQALSYGLNRKEMVQGFFENRQKTALHFSTELDSWYTDKPSEVRIYEYNKTKALSLLEQAGWKLGADGIRVSGFNGGQRLSFTIVGAADNRLNEMLQVYLQSAWKQLGVELKVKNYPARVLFSEILRKRNFEMGLYSWVASPDGSQRALLHSEMIPSQANNWSGSNRPGWKNKNVDKWVIQVDQEFDPQKRIVLMKKILKAYTEELPALPLYYRSNNSIIPRGLKNYRLSGHVFSEYLEIEKWRME